MAAARPTALPALPAAPVAAAGLVTAALAGALLAQDAKAGLALACALVLAPLVLLDLPLGLAVWVAFVALERLPGVGIGQTATGLLVLAAWAGTAPARRAATRATLARHRGLVAALALLALWIVSSGLWARNTALVGDALLTARVAPLALVVVATTVRTLRHAHLACAGIVAGAVLSVLAGLVDTGVAAGAEAAAAMGDTDRFLGAAGDPNVLAAGLVPAIALAAGLLGGVRDPLARLALVAAIGVCAVGLVATQSRGGVVAAAAAIGCALVVVRAGRARIVALLVAVGAIAALWFAEHPAALERMTERDTGGGTGRTELWAVAAAMTADHPVLGVGLGNFVAHTADYARTGAVRDFGEYVADVPHVAHSTYLQTAAELGLVGAALLLGIVLGALRATLLAARRLDALGRGSAAALARSALCAQVAALTAAAFVSGLPDKRTWILLALGPALLSVAGARDAEAAP